jgi:hypothetical protein
MVVVRDHLAAVVDGATGKSWHQNRWPGSREVAGQVAEVLRSSGEADDFETVLDRASMAVMDRKRETGCRSEEGASATFAVVHFKKREVWRVGTIWVRIGNRIYPPLPSAEDVVASARALVLRAALLNGTTVESLRRHDPGREAVVPLLAAAERLRNRSLPGGFGSVDGSQVPSEYREQWSVDSQDEVVIATDGYLDVAGDLAAAERALSKRLERDALFIEDPPQTKGCNAGMRSFDDRSYVRAIIP